MTQNQPKWTEIEHLPEWDEEFYEVYTAKKHGKWVMLKTLRPEYRDKEEFLEMIGKERLRGSARAGDVHNHRRRVWRLAPQTA